jgi:precorrin-4/cobalt-precorrin-4 C11-methyltransferase
MPEAEKLSRFAETGATLALHLAIHAIDTVVTELIPHYGADCPVALVMRASWPDERLLRGTLSDIRQKLRAEPMERTALILVGKALGAHDFIESSLYSPEYHRRFRSA